MQKVMNALGDNNRRSKAPCERAMPNGYNGKKDKEIYIYLAYCKGYIKVGVSESPASRMSTLRSGNPFPIELIQATKLPCKMAMDAELAVMKALNDFYWVGDWFKTTRAHARYALEIVVKELRRNAVDSTPAPVEEVRFPGLKRRVSGPNGELFESCAKAAKHLGISRQAMNTRISRQWQGWKWASL